MLNFKSKGVIVFLQREAQGIHRLWNNARFRFTRLNYLKTENIYIYFLNIYIIFLNFSSYLVEKCF